MYNTGYFRSGLGDLIDDAVNQTDPTQAQSIDDARNDPLVQQLHQLALLLQSEKETLSALLSQVSNADAPDNLLDLITQETDLIHQATAQFRAVAAQRGSVQPYALSTFDQTILTVGNWVNTIPSSIIGIVNVVPDSLRSVMDNLIADAADLLKKAGGAAATGLWAGLQALIPVGLAIGAAIWLTGQAERTRTGRALASRR